MGKIIHIGWYNPQPVGGVGKTILEQTKALTKIGIPVEIWWITPDVTTPARLEAGSHCPVWLLPRSKGLISSVLGLPRTTIKWINNRISEVDCFHLHSVFIPTNNHIADFGIPYIITPNGGWEREVLKGRNRLVKWFWILVKERRLWNGASFVQAVSKSELNYLKQKLKAPRVEFVPNGTDAPLHVTPIDGRDILLFMGRYAIHQKGLDRLMAAILQLKNEHKKIPRVVLAGADFRDGQQYVRNFVIENQLENEVEIHGPVHGLVKDDLFNRARIFLHTSRWEGLPLVLLEALAHGVPCLLTKGTNIADEWEEKGCALKVDDSSESIALGILDMLKEDLQKYSNNARRLAINEYAWDAVAARLLILYKESCNPK